MHRPVLQDLHQHKCVSLSTQQRVWPRAGCRQCAPATHQVFFWSSDTHSHVVTCREKTQYSIRQTRTLLHVYQVHKHHRGCCRGAQGPSTEQQTKTRSDDTVTVLCSGLSYIKSVSTAKHGFKSSKSKCYRSHGCVLHHY